MIRPPRRSSRLVPVVLLELLASGAGEAQTTFYGLGDLPGLGIESVGYGVSGDGSTVTGWSRSANGHEAIRWTAAEGLVGLGDLPGGGFSSDAYAASFDGSTIVGSSLSGPSSEAFVWTDSGIVGLGDLPGGIFSSSARGVSADGSTVVGVANGPSGLQAFLWTSAGGMLGLGDGVGFDDFAHGVSADGSRVIGVRTNQTTLVSEAFLWSTASGFVGLGDLPGGDFGSTAEGISADGSTVVGSSIYATDPMEGFDSVEAFRWTLAEGMVGLGFLPGGAQSFAESASGTGSVIVGYGRIGSSGERAFIWNETDGMRQLDVVLAERGVDLTGWTLRRATGVSDDGRVVTGIGSSPTSINEGWVAVLAQPASSTPALGPVGLLLLVAALVGVALRRRVTPSTRSFTRSAWP